MAQHMVCKSASFVVSLTAATTLLFSALIAFPSTSSAAERFETPVGFAVSPTGSANFSIPIDVPPGTAGMAPSLSFNYNSQGGNGMLGMGWGLGGISAIARCGRTMIQDGFLDTVNYNANDRFCLDGQRLVAVNGNYGANGTEYRTERESFTKIVSYSTAGSGPAYFIAQTKSGETLEFGHTVDSAIEAQGKTDIRLWAVNKISDLTGNYMTISYIEDNANGDFRPNRIDYTGNANAALTPYNSVRFVYQTRTDITPMYQGGSVIKTMQRLANVQTYAKVNGTDTLVEDYQIAYEPDVVATFPQQSRVTTIRECDGSATPICLPTTGVAWPAAVTSLNLPIQVIVANAAGALSYGGLNNVMQFADFNGDGKTDYMYIPNGQTYWNIAYSTGTGFTPPIQVIAANAATPPYSSYVNTTWNSTAPKNMQFADFNGDGKTDYMWIPLGQTKWMISYSTGTGFTTPVQAFAASVTTVQSNNLAQNMQFGDFNGDGKTDFMWIPQGQANWMVSYSTGTGFTAPVEAIAANGTNTSFNYSNSPQNMEFADFDGDGKMDYMWIPQGQANWMIVYANTNGIGFTAPVEAIPANASSPTFNNNGIYMKFADFDGDGKTDYMWMPQGAAYWSIVYSNGRGLGFTTNNVIEVQGTYAGGTEPSYNTRPELMQFADFNGDGKMDYMYVPQGKNYWNIVYSRGRQGNTPVPPVTAVIPALVGGYVPYAGPPPTAWNLYIGTWGQYMKFADFNGDGKTDYMYLPAGASYWNIAYSTGTGFTTPVQVIPALVGGYPPYDTVGGFSNFSDFDGDGKMDYMYMPASGAWNVAYSQPNAMVVSSLTTGLGNSNTTSLSYKPLTDNTVYSKDSGVNAAAYPYMDIQAPLYVVSTATVPDGIGGSRSTNYFYTGAKTHLLGGGFLGFRQYDVTDGSTGIKTTTAFTQDYPHQGLPTSVVQYQSNGNILHSVVNTWSYTTYPDTVLPIAPTTYATTDGSKHNWPAITHSVEITNELNGALVTQMISNTAYDDYGNATTVTTTSNDGYSKTIANTYATPDLTKWILGRLTRSTVQSTTP